MLLAAQIILIIAGALLILDAILMFAHRPNLVNKNWPLPCPGTLIFLGVGLILYMVQGL
jgi:uncharacterized membrane protein YidH (DUF202 family)